jgi:hypothetical protein
MQHTVWLDGVQCAMVWFTVGMLRRRSLMHSCLWFCAGQPGPRDPKQEVFLAFARVFSGIVTDGQKVHVLSAAYNPARPDLERQEVQVSAPSLHTIRLPCQAAIFLFIITTFGPHHGM